ncbi:probable E3 ubiquitin-protein ligase RHG1A [Impatiens glandulifera]|uniref:probable E3 ubiquitin-protein ligase RHG1A n=1 Tax=Impatiens glandulifera TaxID=253017 RepID=UPI001FB05738|nr:probable E3 ubiquitin-protein ligase RHG1A [Impatiens glandulifera]XP_047322547.1 probable E3 ubiquitin-protein ligase RHG1A [Impatiens glandulifera]
MQGQRGALGSLPDTMNLQQSNDSTLDPQIFWNSINNNANTVLPDFMVSPPPVLGNSMNQQHRQTLSGWNVGEPSSSIQNQSSSSSSAFTGTGSLLGLQQYEPIPNTSGVNFFAESSNSQATAAAVAIHRDLNMNAVAENVEDDCQIVERPVPPNLNGWMSSSSTDSLSEENGARRLSCKRKAIEGQSSRHGESNVWNDNNNSNGSLSISAPPTLNNTNLNMNPILGLGTGAGAATEIPLEQRNFRVRINSSSRSRQDELTLQNTIGSSNPNAPHMQQLSRLLSLNGSSSALPQGPTLQPRQTPPVVGHAPGLRRTLIPSRWNRGSSSRNVESNPNPNPNPNPLFANVIQQQSTNWSLSNGSGSLSVSSANIGSSSRAGAATNPSGHSAAAGPNWFSNQYPRRLDLVRRSLLAASDFEAGSSSNNGGNVRSGPSNTNLQEAPPAAVVDHGQRVTLPRSRSAALLERTLDGASGLPFPLRTLAAGGEGRTRLMSEIRNVLDLMRRGEALGVEDVMILDQSSVFFRMADVHDRHREMRVDVDNMSYEELLALEDRIGYVSTGLTEELVMNQLKKRKYFTIAMGSQMELEPCCVCQEEYLDGEDIGSLDCGHEFHAGCIKQWLMHKNLCPICKATGLNNINNTSNNNNNTS